MPPAPRGWPVSSNQLTLDALRTIQPNRIAGLWRLLLSLLIIALFAQTVYPQALVAAGDDQGLWILVPEPDTPDSTVVLHRANNDTPGVMHRVPVLSGNIKPNGVSARNHSLWIIHPNGQVQSIHAKPNELQDGWYYDYRIEPSLPHGVAVRGSAMTASGLWALVRVNEREVLEKLDGSEKPVKVTELTEDELIILRRKNMAIGLPPNYGLNVPPKEPTKAEDSGKPGSKDSTGLGKPTETEQDESDKSVTPALPVDRLLHLKQGKWVRHALPEDWPHGARAWLIAEAANDTVPTLAARHISQGASKTLDIEVYRQQAGEDEKPGWVMQAYSVEQSDRVGSPTVLAVEGQLVVALTHFEAGQLASNLSVLRGDKRIEVGQMQLTDVSAEDWAILGTSTAASLIARAPTEQTDEDLTTKWDCLWTRMDVRGQVLLEPSPLAAAVPSKMDAVKEYFMIAFMAVLVTLLMLAFWRRDASWNRLELPEDLVVADLGKRAVAATIDILPGFIGSMFYFGMSMDELFMHWPGNGIAHTLEQVMPGVVVILTFVAHTTISELIFARTLGKALTGLRTTNLRGERPRIWQILTRGLLKSLDLVMGALPLLVLPMLSPTHQRLGDLIGRTVVVSKAPKPDEDEGEDNAESE